MPLIAAIIARARPTMSISKLSTSTSPNLFQSRKVLITGASGALGRSMVEKFSLAGFEVVGTRSPSSKEMQSPYALSMKWHGVDVTDPGSVQALAKEIGPVDVLVHCAGGFRFAMSEDILDRDIDFLVDTNLKSAIYLVREFIPTMKQRNYGRVIFISSKSTLQPGAGMFIPLIIYIFFLIFFVCIRHGGLFSKQGWTECSDIISCS